MRVMGIDYGSVRIGVALSDPLQIIAQGFTTIPNNSNTIDELLKIIKEQNVEKVVVGMPYNLKGEVGSKAEEVERFIEQLRKNTTIEIVSLDERFTSVIAQQTILSMGTTKKKRQQNKGKVDEVASAILLQNYLDSKKDSVRG